MTKEMTYIYARKKKNYDLNKNYMLPRDRNSV